MSYIGEIPRGYAVCNPLSDEGQPPHAFNILTLGSSHLGFGVDGTWLEQIVPLTTGVAQFSSLWQANDANGGAGGSAVLGGVRTSDATTINANVFGVSGYAICDAPSVGAGFSRVGWGGYFETRRMPGASFGLAVESDILNFGNTVPITPYDVIPDGITPNLWLASGRSDPTGIGTNPATCAIGIINNGDTYDKGIVFHATALEGNDGINGIANAIAMPKGDAITWFEPATRTDIAQIRSDTPDAATTGFSIVFAGRQLRFDSFDGSATHVRIDGVDGADNYLIITSALTGGNVGLNTNAGHLTLGSTGGEVHITDKLITGEVDILGDIAATGGILIGGTLSVGVDVSVGNDLNVVGDIANSGGLTVGGSVSLGATLTVGDNVDIDGAIVGASSLSVSGAIFSGDSVSTTGGITANGDIISSSAAVVAGSHVVMSTAAFAVVSDAWTLFTDSTDGNKLKAKHGTTLTEVIIGTP